MGPAGHPQADAIARAQTMLVAMPAEPRPGDCRRVRVLIVDDDPAIRMLLLELLGDSCCVDEAADGEEALTKLKYGAFDLVLSDVEMPRVGGLRLLEIVRVLFPDTWVVLMSGTPDYRSAACARGATLFLDKPFDITTLFELIRARSRGATDCGPAAARGRSGHAQGPQEGAVSTTLTGEHPELSPGTRRRPTPGDHERH